jgi:putative endonuclease
MTWTAYILKCADGTLYTGITNDLEGRLAAHEGGTGAKYTRGRGPFRVVFTESHPTRSAASKRELEIKRMPRAEKMRLLKSRV